MATTVGERTILVPQETRVVTIVERRTTSADRTVSVS